MVAEHQVEDVSQVQHEDLVAYIIFELLPLFADACGSSAAARWRRRLLIAEVDRLCTEYGPL